jgi:hypothetical protein
MCVGSSQDGGFVWMSGHESVAARVGAERPDTLALKRSVAVQAGRYFYWHFNFS